MGTLIGPRERVAFGTSTESQRAAWSRRHFAPGAPPVNREAGALGGLADAYAYGWMGAAKARGASEDHMRRLYAVASVFGAEYAHAAWLYLTERVCYRESYVRAWEDALTAAGLD
jgi:hypothetical protein